MSSNTQVLSGSPVEQAAVTEEVKRILAGISGVPIDAIQDEQTLMGDLAWDSLDLVECAMEIEEQFDLSVPEDMMDEVPTVREVIDGVMQLIVEQRNTE